MTIYKIKIGEKIYEVEVEKTNEPVSEVEYKKDTKSNSSLDFDKDMNVEGEAIKSPLQASVFMINVAIGQSVKKGELLMVLEAMKLENEILSPIDGIVRQIYVNKSDNVETDDVLLIIE